MKAYPVSEDALDQLATLNRDATILLTLAGAAFGFALDLGKDVYLAGAPAEKIAMAAGVGLTAGVAAAVLAGLGIWKWIERGNKLKAIKASAIFPD